MHAAQAEFLPCTQVSSATKAVVKGQQKAHTALRTIQGDSSASTFTAVLSVPGHPKRP